MPRITISYRRDDSGVITGRIFDRLAAHFGRDSVFRDIDSIPPGVDFREYVAGVIAQSDVLLAIIGPKWVGARGAHHRLNDDADPVRVEIESALQGKVPVIPVLVLHATMPRLNQLPGSITEFAYRHAVNVDANEDFDIHMTRLVRALDRIFSGQTWTGLNSAHDLDEIYLPPGDPGDPVPAAVAEVMTVADQPAPTTPPTSDVGKSPFDVEILAGIERDLSVSIGPLARIAMRRAAGQAHSVEELYRIVSLYIAGPAERASFLQKAGQQPQAFRSTPIAVAQSETTPGLDREKTAAKADPAEAVPSPHPSVSLAPDAMHSIETNLAAHIGPIARIVLRQQLSKSTSLAELYSSLATYIPDEKGRAQFLLARRDR